MFELNRDKIETKNIINEYGCYTTYGYGPESMLKVIRTPYKELLFRSFQEIVLSSNHDHPRILKYKGFHIEMEPPNFLIYVKMARMKMDLEQFMTYRKSMKQALDKSEVIEILYPIVEALAYLHSKEIVHREIDPKNIFLGENNSSYIGAVGTSYFLSDLESLKKSQMDCNPYYVPPEVIEHQIQKRADFFKTDVWSLGILGIELCLLRKVFTLREMGMKEKITKLNKCLEEVRRRLGDELADLLRLMTLPNVSERPTMENIKLEIQDIFGEIYGVKNYNKKSDKQAKSPFKTPSKPAKENVIPVTMENYLTPSLLERQSHSKNEEKSAKGTSSNTKYYTPSKSPSQAALSNLTKNNLLLNDGQEEKNVAEPVVNEYVPVPSDVVKEDLMTERVKSVYDEEEQIVDIPNQNNLATETEEKSDISDIQNYLEEDFQKTKLSITFQKHNTMTLRHRNLYVTNKDLDRLERVFTALAQDGNTPFFEQVTRVSVDFRNCKQITDQGLSSLIQALGNMNKMRHLSLDFGWCENLGESSAELIGNLFASLPALQSLSLGMSGLKSFGDEGLAVLGVCVAKLEKIKRLFFNFDGCEEIKDFGMNMFLSFLPQFINLEKLTIQCSWCPNLTNAGIKGFESALQNLIKLKSIQLSFINCNELGDDGLFSIAKGLSGLGELSTVQLFFSNCKNVTDNSLEYLSEAFSRSSESIKCLELQFSWCEALTDAGISFLGMAIQQFENLDTMQLAFNHCKQITDDSFKSIGAALLGLQNILNLDMNFHGCQKLTDYSTSLTAEILRSQQNLRSFGLDFGWNTRISGNGLGNLGGAIGDCKLLVNLKLFMTGCHLIGDKNLNLLGEFLPQKLTNIQFDFSKTSASVEGIKKLHDFSKRIIKEAISFRKN